MRVTATVLLLVVTLLTKVSPAEDIYWEGDDDLMNEFLEVDTGYSGIAGHFKRLKRQAYGLFSSTPSSDNEDNVTEDDEDKSYRSEDLDNEVDGSGQIDRLEPELKEKTLRVTFVAMEPYQFEYSNRDSSEFQTFSKSLAEAVNEVFRDLPGTHRASLVRIQSRPTDAFSCKVTLDIVTTGNEDTSRISKILRDYIRNKGMLGTAAVNDEDFSSTVIDLGNNGPLENCGAYEIKCLYDGRCLPTSARCDGKIDCPDSSDEADCPIDEADDNEDQTNYDQDDDKENQINEDLEKDNEDNDDNDDELIVPYDQTTTTSPVGNGARESNERGDNIPEDDLIVASPRGTSPSCNRKWLCEGSDVEICEDQKCNGVIDCPNRADEINCDYSEIGIGQTDESPETSTDNPDEEKQKETICLADELRCDETRCIRPLARCDGVRDCDDGTDEENCPESCSDDDFRCDSGKCIISAARCNGVVDCANGEDEKSCECRQDEFTCADDGSCIESRKVCDGFSDCGDSSDEQYCSCRSDEWQCDHGNCIKRSKRCDGRVDCHTDRSDERNCMATGYFKCKNGKLIPKHQRCNRRYDCDSGDYSDEQNCPCGDGDFKCDNGYCIPASKKCDRTHDCQDGSDERDCTYGTICMAYQYKCSNGDCVPADSWCNGTHECIDASDEKNCPCKRGQFKCQDGSCINIAKRCNGYSDCRPNGEDELNCASSCPAESYTCDSGSSTRCAKRCDGVRECDAGEDEDGCFDCNLICDGNCIEDSRICDQIQDCSDGSDERSCDECDGPNDFRCKNGDCLNIALRCNNVAECDDSSDELDCNVTIISEPAECNENQFQCRDDTCIDIQFFCDGHQDCTDNSDEDNCPWFMKRPSRVPSEMTPCHESEFTCYDGRCIPHIRRCDNFYDCSDFSDEQNCYNTACPDNNFQCKSGQCVPLTAYCNDYIDCEDESDESDCTTTFKPFTTAFPSIQSTTIAVKPYVTPSTSAPDTYTYPPSTTQRPFFTTTWNPYVPYGSNSNQALNLTTYPSEQTVRNGGDVVFSCRDVSSNRASVRWVREGGRPLKPDSTDRNGRLEMTKVTSGDSGVYICQAPRYLGSPGSEIRVTLTVEAPGPVPRSSFIPQCQSYQATCGNGECIPKSSVCDDKKDCSDGSDEDSCHRNGLCQPNEFKCANRKCVLKFWVCDSDDDCGDGSDEENCLSSDPNRRCQPSEFACASNNQCVPKSFHCDGQDDCFDKSDEIGCAPIHVTRLPSPANVRLNPGETLTLVCEAVGVPVPLITWRRNWDFIPEKCSSKSVNGIGTLTCPNMEIEDSGAYSCEAINNKGSTFATQDSIVYVNRTGGVCPSGYFNSEARSQNECIRCFCFGKSTQCQSADLFIFNMPTPLGEGGTRLVGVNQDYNGNVQIDKQDISNRYYYQPLRNAAMVTKLMDYGSTWPRTIGAHPFITLPETYNGNQLTSYGGRIKYRISAHNPSTYTAPDNTPDIIILGKYQILLHKSRSDLSREPYIDARLTPGDWQKPSPRGLVQAYREDIMMALDDIELILLRADSNNAGVNITDFTMESAQTNNIGLGAASLVEECTCPAGYKGRSCEKCADGFDRQNSGPWNGTCVPKAPCPPMTYGDPSSGGDCKPCPCPLTNRGNQFGRSCSVGPRGNVVCDCLPGYEGPDCSYCAPNYIGNPLIVGDSCKPKPQDNCNPLGTSRVRLPDECVCKENVQGRYCDQCKNGSFFLSNDFRHGCALCFCSGVSQQCMISNFRRKTTTVRFNVPQIVSQVKLYQSAPIGPAGSVRYNAPTPTDLQPELLRGEIGLNNFERYQESILYWSLPLSFAGDKVTSYGGFLTYELRNVPTYGGLKNTAADVQLISNNSLSFHYFGNFEPTGNGYLNASVQFLEKGWQRPDGKQVSREHFLLALADVETILIKATYSANTDVATIVQASIDTADPYGDGPLAQHVEQCVCPMGYIGTSCEDCAPGYTRSSTGIYLEHCGLCDCNGHSSMCHPETGVCFDCADNTAGPNCEACKDGFELDQNNNCIPTSEEPQCNCDPRGEAQPCDSFGRCICKQNVEGERCDRCRPGTFGLSDNNPLGCDACYCSGATNDCHEANHYSRIRLPAPIIGEDYGGYTLMDLNADQIINDQFIPAPKESELKYVFTYPYNPIYELYWSLPVFPGNRVLSYGGTLSLTQSFETGGYPEESSPGRDIVLVGESLSLYWSNLTPIRSGEALSYQVPLRENNWFMLNSPDEASRQDFMSVLKNLKRVLVRATLSQNITSTSIADVSMDIATEAYDNAAPPAKGVEVCMCPEGYTGTSCENCAPGFYQDRNGYCRQCNCNGNDCQLNSYGTVVCNCRPPYTGPDCLTVGLIMELHPTIHGAYPNSSVVQVTFTCKYRAPEPLSIKFYYEGHEVQYEKHYNESRLYKDGWRGVHVWHTQWNTKRRDEIYECRTITANGFVLGVLFTTLPEKDGTPSTTFRPPPESTIEVIINSPTIKIENIGGTVNFTCQARSRMSTNPLQVNWYKENGYLPQSRHQIDSTMGLLIIYNLEESDSGKYICQTSDGISTQQAIAELKVSMNEMTKPTASVSPSVKEAYEGDRIELICTTTGNPAPKITWQRADALPLPRSIVQYDALLIIENANVRDTAEYRCIASNSAGSSDGIAAVTVRPNPTNPKQALTVSTLSPTIDEGQSTQIVCTGTPSIPSGTIDWIRQDGAILLPNVRSDNGILYIDIAIPENQGVYICQTTPYIDVNPVLVRLTVVPTILPSQPNITVSVEQLKIPTGGTGTVDCKPHGYPLPLIKWIKYEPPFGPTTSQRDNMLIITNAQESDGGYYLCEGSVEGRPVVSTYVYVDIERREAPGVSIYPQGEHSVILGSPYELQCSVNGGVPEPAVTWHRADGRPLLRHVQIQSQNRLSFQAVEVNDEGEYVCTATNDAGTVTASAVIKVRSPPVITIRPSTNIKVYRGERVEVECRAEGYPEPEVSIMSSSGRLLVSPSPRIAVLSISSANEDEDYTCTATSVAGSIKELFTIYVERGDTMDPGFEPNEMAVIEGRQSRISCNASNEFEVMWSRADRNPLQPNARQIVNELIIENTTKSDSGVYECTLVNRRTRVPQQSAQTRLLVVAPPSIILKPRTQTVRPGQSPTVECFVDGDDIIEVIWRPKTSPLSSRVEIRDRTLIFHKIEVEDAGEYECFARNSIASAAAIAEVKFSEETGRASHDNEQSAHAGSAVNLSCNVTLPWRSIRWTKNGRAIPRSVIQKSDGSLFIRIAQKSDSGRYVCAMTDVYGRQISNYINLQIEGYECSPTQFRCNDSSSCINYEFLCDGNYDCQDGSDEFKCHVDSGRECPETQFHCKTGSDCIDYELVCDGNSDCLDHSDEIDCDMTPSPNDTPGYECPPTQFRCNDSSSCINYEFLCDGNYDCQDGSDEFKCHVDSGPRDESLELVKIDQPRRQYRVGDKVEVLCRAISEDVRVTWERFRTRLYVDSREYSNGAILLIPEVQEFDVDIYRCIGQDRFGRISYDNFTLRVIPGPDESSYEVNNRRRTARLGDTVDLPCNYTLEEPVTIEWRREYSQLPSGVRQNERILHLEDVSEADAGTYVCRVTNPYTRVETRASLRVIGVVPKFNGDSWLAMKPLKDAYMKFDIEISFKPADPNGIILYNSETGTGTGDYLILQLVNGIPEFTLKFDTSNPLIVTGDRPLQLNTWHTIRLNRSGSKVTMDVDNHGPYVAESSNQGVLNVLDLNSNLYIGGIPEQRPLELQRAPGFYGCVSMLILGKEEKNMMSENVETHNVGDCDSCIPNLCLNEGVCQETRNDRGYSCLCPAGFAGLNCDRAGEACRQGLCGLGKCTDTIDGYKCTCPVTYTGRNCEIKQNIAYPAFAGSAYLAIKPPKTSRFLSMSMKIRPKAPVTDGIIMYCAQSARGYGGFTSLAVHDGRLEFRYDLGDENVPIVLISNKTLAPNEWTDVRIARVGHDVSMKIDMTYSYEAKLASAKDLNFETSMFVGGVDDDSIVLNNNTGVTGGFNGCIKDVTLHGSTLDLNNASIQAANVQECVNYDRGDIPETDSICSQCRNNGYCTSPDMTACICPPGYTGLYCQDRVPPSWRSPSDSCSASPCINGGTCKVDYSHKMNYSCDCPLGFSGFNCQMRLELLQSVGFNGNGYLELPASYLRYDELDYEPELIALAFHTFSDGVLLYQREAELSYRGDYILLRVSGGVVVMEWDLGSGRNVLSVDDVMVTDGERHNVIAKLYNNNTVELTVDMKVRTEVTNGISNVMNADSNIYIGGIPDYLNSENYLGLMGCIEQVEFKEVRSVNLGSVAVAGRNTQPCKE